MLNNQQARCSWRNVHIYDATTQNYIGGVHQAGSITYANLNDILRNILLLADNFSIRQKSSGTIHFETQFETETGNVWFPAEGAYWQGFEISWNGLGYSNVSNINSVQNGLFLKRDLYAEFDQYLFSINPDDGYKIISFTPDEDEIDGRVLDPVCRDPANPDHVSDEFLRWHYRQSILANMRGVGEPIFKWNFLQGRVR